MAKQNKFDLILTDIGLPGLSGLELVEEIRKWEKENHLTPVPIIGLTAHVFEKLNKTLLKLE